MPSSGYHAKHRSAFKLGRKLMNRIASLVVAIISIICAQSSHAERWEKFESFGKYDFDKKTVYFSAEKIKTRDGYIQAWQLEDYVSTQKKLDKALLKKMPPSEIEAYPILSSGVLTDKPSMYVKSYKSMLSLMFADCIERKLAFTEFNGYRDNMGAGPLVYEEKPQREFSTVVPRSVGEHMLESICKDNK